MLKVNTAWTLPRLLLHRIIQKIYSLGHAYIGEGYDTVLMITNDDCSLNNLKSIKGTLNIYSKIFKKK